MENKEVLLSLKNVKTYFPVKKGVLKKTVGYVKAVDDISIDVYKGETLGLVGESGCGKTTLGKSILQLIKATDGTMEYKFEDGMKDLRKLPGSELDNARKKLQIVFQDPHSSLNPAFTIFQSLEDPLKKFGVKTREERRKIIGDLLEAVNMRREYMDRYPHEFSGGQRQRIGIARALSVNPELIVCDEAVSALGCVHTGTGSEPAQEAQGRKAAYLHIHNPRPQCRRVHQRQDRCHVPWKDSRAG